MAVLGWRPRQQLAQAMEEAVTVEWGWRGGDGSVGCGSGRGGSSGGKRLLGSSSIAGREQERAGCSAVVDPVVERAAVADLAVERGGSSSGDLGGGRTSSSDGNSGNEELPSLGNDERQ